MQKLAFPDAKGAKMPEEVELQLRRSWIERAGDEARELLVIFLYLYICLGALLLYKIALLQAQGIDYAPFGLAAIKALILAKFMLIGQAVGVGEGHARTRVVHRIFYKSVLFLILLFVLSVVEEVVAGMIHGRPILQSLSGFAGGTWLQVVATSILIWLILFPYFAFREMSQRLGKDGLRRMLLGNPE